MSISVAPAATASRVSSTLTSSDVCPAGKPVDTDATATPLPRSASYATPTSDGYTQTAATDGISGRLESGQTAFAHRWRTLPGVSAPSSVVRSIIEVASRIPWRLASFLIERLPSVAARSSTRTLLTGTSVRLMPHILTRLVSGRGRRDRGDRLGRRRAGLVEHAERLELGHQHDVPRGHGDVAEVLGPAAAVEPLDVGVGDRDEVLLVGVEEVGHARAVALVGQLQRALDRVAGGLDADALAAEEH